MFKWLDASEAKEFGESLADYFIARIPLDPDSRKNKSVERHKEVVDKLLFQIQVFRGKHQLNFYQKAKLANTFKWKLLDAKYDPEFVDSLTKLITVKF
ncbi:MAG TPA: hypothetical protein VF928_02650 [Usitatibacteraceae bacterium]